MTRIAHLSDLHLLETAHRSSSVRRQGRLSFLNLGRRIDPEDRCERLLRALQDADRMRADHIVITGDLTEEGTSAQFAVLAAVLTKSHIDPSRITLVPGNHDAYDSHDGYARALYGPLDRWRATSTPGKRVDLDHVVLLPLSTAMHQHWLFAVGSISEEHLRLIGETARTVSNDDAFAVIQHHSPTRYAPVFQTFGGLQDLERMRSILHENRRTHVLHGHTHYPSNRFAHPADEDPRLFCAPAVVTSRSPLRLYEAINGKLVPIEERGVTPLVLPPFAPSPA